MSNPPIDPVMEHRVGSLERAYERSMASLTGIEESLRKLIVLEAHHAQTRIDVSRAFDNLRVHEDRIRALELEAPQMRMVTKHVIAGVVAVVGMAGVAAAKVTFGW